MQKNYQSPEAVEIGKADSIILGPKDNTLFDEPDEQFVRTISSAVDVDE
jgi:hypothetical protein